MKKNFLGMWFGLGSIIALTCAILPDDWYSAQLPTSTAAAADKYVTASETSQVSEDQVSRYTFNYSGKEDGTITCVLQSGETVTYKLGSVVVENVASYDVNINNCTAIPMVEMGYDEDGIETVSITIYTM